MSTTAVALALLVTSFTLCTVLVPFVRAGALRMALLDQPGRRKIHAVPVPRVGGVAMFVAWVLPLCVFMVIGDPRWSRLFGDTHMVMGIMLAGGSMFALGLYDDTKGCTARLKLPVEIAVAIALYTVGFRIDHVSNPFGAGSLLLGPFALPVTVLWVVGVTNAFNLLDGIDGLAAGVAAITGAVMGLAALHTTGPVGMFYAVSLVGVALGFLVHNFPPASIFMGDCGSLFLGGTLAALSLVSSQKGHTAVAVFVPMLIFGLPLADTGIAVLRRYLSGRSLFEGDSRHVHHMLLAKGLSSRRVVLILYGTTAILGATALLMVTAASRYSIFVAAAVLIGIIVACSRLGYYEFNGIREHILHGGKFRRRLAFRHELVRAAAEAIAQEQSLDTVWGILSTVANLLQFDRASLELNGHAVPSAASPAGERRVWERAYVENPTAGMGPIVVPIANGGREFGELRLERRHAEPRDPSEGAALDELAACVAACIAKLEGELGSNPSEPGAGSQEAAEKGQRSGNTPDA